MRMPATAPSEPGANPSCQKVNQILARMGDKWTILTITRLAQQPRRFNELKRLIGGISQQMLTRTLKALERDGMVTRTVYPTVPPQVEYALTELGGSLSLPLMQLATWVLDHLDQIEMHRALHDHVADRPRA
ncbi:MULTISPECIES: winged helix-turn-helix transcriptional regulator [Burkholderia cepacia complex]|uniref:winged helix-turn-helix transcriptional regulator n=1 Tax=Burkholderia cepacia complex TaxID=87882 RepID=UPI0007577C96|nr:MULTISPECIES: helix-turn-helix domain-containing protein [Burkholderia cepacia complex]KVE90411.1 HxlR family transcriptional regulator [Burkholderia cepacia]KVF30703.1 HxlR family transcriptional regulator [Burkholderia vietnamiensis]KVF40972.1 HxlR family transcriptional regulator [Burkholderia vietnamiensis]MCA8098487.1 helix-turn-helix transcriptional regulator [Burkholderia contaminans]MCA8288425.1 helix-turn-helix transcriptional regulator [Burkholderia vietnamiensis]